MKIDVEGLELAVLQGFGGLLGRADVVICEIGPEWADTASLFATMRDAGFKYLASPPMHGTKWFYPETRVVEGQHDALFYREMTPALASLVR